MFTLDSKIEDIATPLNITITGVKRSAKEDYNNNLKGKFSCKNKYRILSTCNTCNMEIKISNKTGKPGEELKLIFESKCDCECYNSIILDKGKYTVEELINMRNPEAVEEPVEVAQDPVEEPTQEPVEEPVEASSPKKRMSRRRAIFIPKEHKITFKKKEHPVEKVKTTKEYYEELCEVCSEYLCVLAEQSDRVQKYITNADDNDVLLPYDPEMEISKPIDVLNLDNMPRKITKIILDEPMFTQVYQECKEVPSDNFINLQEEMEPIFCCDECFNESVKVYKPDCCNEYRGFTPLQANFSCIYKECWVCRFNRYRKEKPDSSVTLLQEFTPELFIKMKDLEDLEHEPETEQEEEADDLEETESESESE